MKQIKENDGPQWSNQVAVTVTDLMSRGFFHNRIVPALTSAGLEVAMVKLVAFANDDRSFSKGAWKTKVTTSCVRHSYPKRRLSRRILSIPHPRNQIFVSLEVEKHWHEMKLLCDQSRISLTCPSLSGRRALQGAYERKDEATERVKRSVGSRFVLHADLSRFYPSIYTHSIPWAIHGKDQRHNRGADLYGNLLDLWIRETQSKQTGGIPVGPDTSYLIAEVIASQIDKGLESLIGELRGTRYIDDYHLYFESRGRAEQALSELHRVAALYELDINDLKTSIEELPESIEPPWKTQLRSVFLAKRDHATSLKTVFDLAAMLAKQFEQDGVFAYLVRRVETVLSKLHLDEAEWEIVEALLLRAAVGDPSCLPTVLRIFEKNLRQPGDADAALNSICINYAALQHSSEVAWALWSAKRLQASLSQAAADAVELMDDDVVALVALNLEQEGYLPTPANDFALWRTFMNAGALYSDHWLLAYEAFVQGWLPSGDGKDYVKSDPYFSILQQAHVRFFDTSDDVEVEEDEGYDDDPYSEDEDEDDDDDEDESETEEDDSED